MIEELYNKIDKFCNETDWSKYPTYEHALEEFIKGIVAKETAELKEALKGKRCNCMTYLNFKDLEKECAKAKELLKRWVELYKPKLEGYPITPIQEQTEQFLKESE